MDMLIDLATNSTSQGEGSKLNECETQLTILAWVMEVDPSSLGMAFMNFCESPLVSMFFCSWTVALLRGH